MKVLLNNTKFNIRGPNQHVEWQVDVLQCSNCYLSIFFNDLIEAFQQSLYFCHLFFKANQAKKIENNFFTEYKNRRNSSITVLLSQLHCICRKFESTRSHRMYDI